MDIKVVLKIFEKKKLKKKFGIPPVKEIGERIFGGRKKLRRKKKTSEKENKEKPTEKKNKKKMEKIFGGKKKLQRKKNFGEKKLKRKEQIVNTSKEDFK